MYIDYNFKIKIIALYLYKYKIKSKLKTFILVYIISKIIDYKNEEYIKFKVLENKDSIYNKEQLEAIYLDELLNIVIAPAGSGKTSLIVGKINYLIDTGYKEKEILCISFTNAACDNLKKRLKYNVDVMTFHKLAKLIVGNEYKINNNYLEYVIDEYFYTWVKDNIKIKIILLMLINKINLLKYDYYLNNGYFNNLKKEIKQFINLFIISGYDYNSFLKFKHNKGLMRIIIDIYYLYISELNSQKEIDLNVLIKKAENINIKLDYKYIIIDEFQDISKTRFELIKNIIKLTNSKLLAVGDDYQSIYKFSGSNLDSFYNIINKNDEIKVMKLKNNYRNCQEIVNIATSFIMKNKRQIKKQVIATKSIKKPVVIVKEKENILIKLINYIDSNVLILGRNNKDINKYLSDIKQIKSNKRVNYMTVHKSKGLEEDNVIIINLTNKIDGFPSKIKNSKIIEKYFLKEKYKYEEERRLFYVALTRSRGKVYLLESEDPSIFLKEIKKDYKKYITYLNL